MGDRLIRALKNAWGRLRGLSGCRCCGDSFDWKPFHITTYRWAQQPRSER
jgi:hypothetical protein